MDIVCEEILARRCKSPQYSSTHEEGAEQAQPKQSNSPGVAASWRIHRVKMMEMMKKKKTTTTMMMMKKKKTTTTMMMMKTRMTETLFFVLLM